MMHGQQNVKIKFHVNPPGGSRVVHEDGRTDIKLTVTFRNFANAPKNGTGKITSNQINSS